MAWGLQDITDLRGRLFVVTGANAGIGFATVKALVGKRARVVMACRSLEKGNAAAEQIRSLQPDAEIQVEQLDLARLASVKSFSERLKTQFSSIDVLVNNAGVMMPALGHTDDGFELQFGTNFLGPFALTGHLLPLLASASGARIVTLTSIAHWIGTIDFDNLGAERTYRRFPAYAQSKLANLVFTQELQRRLDRNGLNIVSAAAHPGVTQSELARHSLSVNLMMPVVAQSTEMGALPSLMAATSTTVKGGDLVGPGRLLMWGSPAKQRCSRQARDLIVGEHLWQAAQKLTGVRYL